MITADEIYKLEENATETPKKFKFEQIEINKAIDMLISLEKCYLYNIDTLTSGRDNKFPKTMHPAFYTLDDLISYIEPVPKKEAMDVLLKKMIVRDNFLKEEVLFLKYLDLLEKSTVSFHDLVFRDNPSVNFRSLVAICKHIETRYKKHEDEEESLLLLSLSPLVGEEEKNTIVKKARMNQIITDHALNAWEFIKTEKGNPQRLANIVQGYLALLWIRSIILKTGKTIVTTKDLSFCKSIASIQVLIEAYKNFHKLKDPFRKLLISQYCKDDSVEENNTTQSCNNILEAAIIGECKMLQLPMSYRDLYTGKNSTIILVLSFLWDVAVNFFKMNEFEDTPPLDSKVISYLLFKVSNEPTKKHRKESIKHYIYRKLELFYYKLNVLNEEILPLLCTELYEVLHSQQIFYKRPTLREIIELETPPEFYRLAPC